MTAEAIVRALQGRRSGSGWMVKCPEHNDRNPSLSVQERDGRVLVHCHAGCSQEAVIRALRNLGIWPEREDLAQGERIDALYDYTAADGTLLYQIVRKTGKQFLQRYPNGVGGWIWKKHPEQVLYHLREVLENAIVFVVEGEKDVEKLREHGFVATTNAGGARAQWLPEYTAALAGREVIIIPDNEVPGWERATRIARALLGTAARIRIFDLPKDTKDISDWFEAGHSECELIALLEDVHAV